MLQRRGLEHSPKQQENGKPERHQPGPGNRLVQFAKYGKVLGNGLAVIDFGSRIGNIRNSYKAGDNWEREMFIESASFAASATTGLIAAEAGASALVFLVAMTSMGPIGLLIGGVVIAGAAAGASMSVNDVIRKNSDSWYDSIMQWLKS